MRRVKEAYSLSVFFGDHCDCVHIALEDDQNRPFATAALSPEIVHAIQEAQDKLDRRRRIQGLQ
jgi:hypothetical protein